MRFGFNFRPQCASGEWFISKGSRTLSTVIVDLKNTSIALPSSFRVMSFRASFCVTDRVTKQFRVVRRWKADLVFDEIRMFDQWTPQRRGTLKLQSWKKNRYERNINEDKCRTLPMADQISGVEIAAHANDGLPFSPLKCCPPFCQFCIFHLFMLFYWSVKVHAYNFNQPQRCMFQILKQFTLPYFKIYLAMWACSSGIARNFEWGRFEMFGMFLYFYFQPVTKLKIRCLAMLEHTKNRRNSKIFIPVKTLVN